MIRTTPPSALLLSLAKGSSWVARGGRPMRNFHPRRGVTVSGSGSGSGSGSASASASGVASMTAGSVSLLRHHSLHRLREGRFPVQWSRRSSSSSSSSSSPSSSPLRLLVRPYTPPLIPLNLLYPRKGQQQQQQRRSYSPSPQTPLHQGGVADGGDVATTSTTDNNAGGTTTTAAVVVGSKAFVDCDRHALVDLFDQHATLVVDDTNNTSLENNNNTTTPPHKSLTRQGLQAVLHGVGENPDQSTLNEIFDRADLDGNGVIDLDEFLASSDQILGQAPAGIVLLVGGPGSGKGVLSKRLEKECGVVHLSSGDLLRNEVRKDTVLGRQVKEVMARGELVSSAVIVTLIRRVMRDHAPGKRVLLDGFPRSAQNAHDLVELCGRPELALHLQCDDTILMERILKRRDEAAAAAAAVAAVVGEQEALLQNDNGNGDGDNGDGGDNNNNNNNNNGAGQQQQYRRDDDNIHTALKRLRTYHKYQTTTMDWLRDQHIPVVNLDCSGTPDQVWQQLLAIGRLMRPATQIIKTATPATVTATSAATTATGGDSSNISTNKAGVVNGKAGQHDGGGGGNKGDDD